MSLASHIGRVGVRARLMLLLAVAMLPLGALIAVGIVMDSRSTLDLARTNLRRTADLAVARQADLFAGARALLEATRASADVTAAGGAGCERTMRSMLAGRPQFLTLGVLEADGTISCHSTLRKRIALAYPGFAGRVLAPGAPDLVVGDFMIGKVTGKPTVAVGMRLPEGAGPAGVVFVSLDLERLSQMAESASDHGRFAVTMVQPSSGRMLTHFPPIPLPFGTTLEGGALVEAMRSRPEGGVIEARGPDEVERVYGFAPVPGAETAGMMLAVGEPRLAILSPVRSTAVSAAVLGAATFLLALAATWWLGLATQLRPIRAISRFARRIGAGDYAARTDLEPWQAPELRSLGRAMNAAAAKLETARLAEAEVAASESRYRLLAENTADLVTALDATGRRIFVSPASRDILGRRPEELLGLHPRELAHPDDAPTVDAMLATLSSGSPVGGVRYRVAHSDGRYVWVEVSGRPLDGGGGTVLAIRDISERRRMEEHLEEANRRLAELASTDGLTGLLNRRGFDEALDREVARSRREGTELALLLIDVDRFKAFNDRHGHLRGDECLRQIAAAVGGALRRPGDTTARYGGEELAVILPDTSARAAMARAEAIVEGVRRLGIDHAGSEHGVVTVSVGVASLASSRAPTRSGTPAIDLIDRADKALYRAKAHGRDRAFDAPPGQAVA